MSGLPGLPGMDGLNGLEGNAGYSIVYYVNTLYFHDPFVLHFKMSSWNINQ